VTRLATAWRTLEPEQRLAALTALGLFASMFLPWYGKTDTVVVHGAPKATATSLSAFQAFSFVEAAVLLVSAGVLAMLFARAERRPFQLPGGDGRVVIVAGAWCALLIFYRTIDKPGLHGNDKITATVGVEWGIFIALLLALGLTYAGARLRALERPEPPLRRERRARAGRPRESREERRAPDAEPTVVVPARPLQEAAPVSAPKRRRHPPVPGEQLSFEDPSTRPER
jgi:hypothetical protein